MICSSTLHYHEENIIKGQLHSKTKEAVGTDYRATDIRGDLEKCRENARPLWLSLPSSFRNCIVTKNRPITRGPVAYLPTHSLAALAMMKCDDCLGGDAGLSSPRIVIEGTTLESFTADMNSHRSLWRAMISRQPPPGRNRSYRISV